MYLEQNNFYNLTKPGDLLNWIKFDNQEQRDRLIDEWYPNRQCTDVPGEYKLSNGNTLVVFMNEAKEYKGA